MSKNLYSGIIYKITHSQMPTECYIGQTKLTLKKRWQEHVRKSRDEKSNIGYGKLHRIISSRDPISFKCEIVYEANSDLDLYEKEDFLLVTMSKSSWNCKIDIKFCNICNEVWY